MNINHLKQTKYAEGANLAFENAHAHYEIAEQASKAGKYGIATSLLVTASEELAKASILKIKSMNNKIRIDNLEAYFQNHKSKHESIFNIFNAVLEHYIDEQSDLPLELEKDDYWQLLVVLIVFAIISSIEGGKSEKESYEDYFEKIRTSGLYLNYNSTTSNWESPLENFSQSDYEEFHETIDEIFKVIENSLFGDSIHKENLVEFANKLEDDNIITGHLREMKEDLKK